MEKEIPWSYKTFTVLINIVVLLASKFVTDSHLADLIAAFSIIVMLTAVTLNVILPKAVMLSFIMLSVVRLVDAPEVILVAK